jgi:hypothetical protein
MLYTKRTVRCAARGLSREEAKLSLEHQFAGSEVLDVKRRGDKWVATLLEPKTAEFPPKGDDEDTDAAPPKAEGSDSEDSPPSEDGDKGESPPKGDKSEGKPKGGEKAELGAVLDLLSAIADKLGIVPPGAVPGAEDPLSPDGGPPPPPPGPPGAGGPPGGPEGPGVGGAGHQEIVHRTKLKPGDTPPGVTPIGSPAFASTNQLSRMASFDAFDDTPGKSIKQAKAELEELYGPHGFKVRQIKRVESGRRLAAKLSRR